MGPKKAQPDNLVRKSYTKLAEDASLSTEQREACGLLAQAEGLMEEEDFDEAHELARQALDLCRSSGYLDLTADAARYVVQAMLKLEWLDDAKREAALNLEDFKVSGSLRGQASMLLCMASFADNEAEELRLAEEACKLFNREGDRRMECAALLASAEAHFKMDEEKGARAAFAAAAAARELAREADDKHSEAKALHAMATAQAYQDCTAECLKLADEALDLYLELKDKRGEAAQLLNMANWSLCAGDCKRALSDAEDALEILQELESPREVDAVCLIYNVAFFRGDFSGARKIVTRGLKRFQQLGDMSAQLRLLILMMSLNCKEGELEFAQEKKTGKYGEALVVAFKVLKVVRTLGDQQGEARILVVVAALNLRLERCDAALHYGEEAFERIKEVGDSRFSTSFRYCFDDKIGLSSSNMSDCMFTLTNAYIKKDQHEEALRVASEVECYFQQRQDKMGEAAALMSANSIQIHLGELEEAVKSAKKALVLYNEAGDMCGEGQCRRFLMEEKWRNQQYNDAVKEGDRACALFREVADRKSEAVVRYGVAVNAIQLAISEGARVGESGRRSRMATDALSKAKRSAEAAMSLAKELISEGQPAGQVLACSMATLAQVLMLLGKPAMALECADEAVIIFREHGDYRSEGMALLQSADALRITGQYEEAKEAAEEAMALCQQFDDKEGVSIARSLLKHLHEIMETDGVPGAESDAEDAEEGVAREAEPSVVEDEPLDGRQQPVPLHVLPLLGAVLPPAEAERVHYERDLTLQLGLNPMAVRDRVLELARRVAGVDEDVFADTPLMEAGMSSNAAILLQNKLAEELPALPLPITLLFDFPSVEAVTHLIMKMARPKPRLPKR